MAGKIYKEYNFGEKKEIVDSEYLAKVYLDGANLLAEAVEKIEEAKSKFESARDYANDNGDPAFEADDVFTKLAICMASALSYAREYTEEISKQEEKEDG